MSYLLKIVVLLVLFLIISTNYFNASMCYFESLYKSNLPFKNGQSNDESLNPVIKLGSYL